MIAFRPLYWSEAVAQTIEWALPGAVGHGDEAVQALALLGCQSLDQAAMEVRVRA